MSANGKKWCERCQWRTPHLKGICQECEQDNGPTEAELEAEGQASIFDDPGQQVVS